VFVEQDHLAVLAADLDDRARLGAVCRTPRA